MVVTALTPSRIGLREYGRYLYDACSAFPDVKFIFASDRDDSIDQLVPLVGNAHVERVWTYNSVTNPLRIVRLALAERPDVIWFNLISTSFGDRPIPAFLGLMTPFLLKLFGFRIFITLHHISAFLDFENTRYKSFKYLFKFFLGISEQMLALSGSVALLLDKYVSHFRSAYFFAKPFRMPHGFPNYPGLVNPKKCKRILVFGKFGSYKKLDFPISIISALRDLDPNWTMTVAGSSHPSYPGYFEYFSNKYSNTPGIDFIGYVKDDSIPDLFNGCGVVLLPYSSATGVSGVAHIAAAFGLPVVAASIDDFLNMGEEEKIGIKFFQTDDVQDAVAVISELMGEPSSWQSLSSQSLDISRKNSTQELLALYLNIFGAESNPPMTDAR